MAELNPFTLVPSPLPDNPLKLQDLRDKLARWLENREADRVKLDKSLDVFLAQVKRCDQELKAGAIPDTPTAPPFIDTYESAALEAEWKPPRWAIPYLTEEDENTGETYRQTMDFVLADIGRLLKTERSSAGKTEQLANLTHTAAALKLTRAVATMESLYDRVLDRLAEVTGHIPKTVPGGEATEGDGANNRTRQGDNASAEPQGDDGAGKAGGTEDSTPPQDVPPDQPQIEKDGSDYPHTGHYKRDLWIYRQKEKKRKNQDILDDLEQLAPTKKWDLLASVSGMNDAANRLARYHGWEIARGRDGRPNVNSE